MTYSGSIPLTAYRASAGQSNAVPSQQPRAQSARLAPRSLGEPVGPLLASGRIVQPEPVVTLGLGADPRAFRSVARLPTERGRQSGLDGARRPRPGMGVGQGHRQSEPE